MKRMLVAALALLLLGATTASAITITVPTDQPTIQAAVDAALAGDDIYVLNGTYLESLNIFKDIILVGQSEAGVTIDASGFDDYSIDASGDFSFYFENFTLIGHPTGTAAYGLKIAGDAATCTVKNVTVQNSRRSAIDLNGLNGGLVQDVTCSGVAYGVGIGVTDSDNITLDGITTFGNAWGGVAIYTYGVFYTGGSDGVTLTGVNSFGEPVGLYTEEDGGYPITNLTIPTADFGALTGDNTAPTFQVYYADTATGIAAVLGGGSPLTGWVLDRVTGEYVAAPGMSIQAAIDAADPGNTVNVAAGIYQEQLYIDKSLDLVGAGMATCTVEAPDAVARTTYSVTQWNGSARTVDAVIGVNAAGTVNITGLTVDGRSTGPDNFYGVHFFDTSGSVTYCTINGILYPTSPGSQRVVALSGSHSAGVPITLDFSYITINDFQKGGILVMGPMTSFTVTNNTVLDAYTANIAGNGIQLSYGASGSTQDNYIQGVGYTGTGWAGTGLLLFESGDITLNGDEVFDCQNGVNYSDWRWVYNHPVPVNLTFNDLDLHDNEWSLGAQLSGDQSDLNIDIVGCSILNSLADGIDLFGTDVDPWGGSYYTGWQNGDLVATITDCTITGTGAGYDGLWTGDSSTLGPNNASVTVRNTTFDDSGNSAINNDFPTATVDAAQCYWNDPNGPIDGGPAPVEPRPAHPIITPIGLDLPGDVQGEIRAEVGGRAGGTYYGSVIASPFLGLPPGTSPMTWGVTPPGTIGAAVAAASAGDFVSVLAGTYVEPVQIVVDKDLTITGAGAATTVAQVGYDTGTSAYSTTSSLFYVDYGVTASLAGLAIDGSGQIVNTGIQSRGADFTLSNCELRNIASTAGSYDGRGIVFLTGTGLVEDCTMSNIFRIGVHIRGAVEPTAPDVTVDGLTYTGKGLGDWLDYGVEFGGGGTGEVLGSDITACSGVATVDGSTSAGILVTDYYGTGTTADISNCDLSGNSSGMAVGYAPTDLSVVTVAGCDFSSNPDYGISSTGPVVAATGNWWGHASGPLDTSNDTGTGGLYNPGGLGVEVTDGVLYDPWSGQAMLSITPDSSGPINCSGSSTLTFNYTPDAMTPPLRGYTIRVTATSEVSFTSSDIVVDDDLIPGETELSQVVENGPNDFTIDWAVLGGTTGVTAVESFFDITFHGDNLGFDSAATVSFVSCELRDLTNGPIGADCTDTATIQVDCLGPNAPTMVAEPTYTQGTTNTVAWGAAVTAAAYYCEANTASDFTGSSINSGWITNLATGFTGLVDGQIYYYRVKARDLLLNESGWSASVSSTQDDSSPLTSVTALGPYQSATLFDVHWTGADVDPGSGDFSGLASVDLFVLTPLTGWSNVGTYTTSPISYTALDGDGTYEFYTLGTDGVGNVEVDTGADTSTIVDTTAPAGTFVVDADAVYTNDLAVTLDNAITDANPPLEMRFSNDSVTWSGWFPYAASHAWTLDAGADGLRTVHAQFRDAAGVVLSINDSILLDTTAPGAVSAFSATTGHEFVDLVWDGSSIGENASLEIWGAVWHQPVSYGTDYETTSAYPEYDDINPGAPVAPADRAEALASGEWELLTTLPDGTESYTDSETARGIYSYTVIPIDLANNDGPPSAVLQAKNYHLGDVQIAYDGDVDAGDITVLGAAYGTSDGDSLYNNECDVGPTDTADGSGIPTTDNLIGFEDLMIFALNYGVVGPMPVVQGSDIAHLTWFELDDGRWALGLTEPCANLKALQLRAALPGAAEANVTAGGLLDQQAGPVFLRQIPGQNLDISLAVLGEGVVISGQGLLFSVSLPAGLTPRDLELVVRDASNADLDFELSATQVEDLPTAYAFAGNYPNPFNPKTRIAFDLPEAQFVRLAVFSADGRRVATLLDEQMPAGRHNVLWEGRDDSGAQAATGVYFARIEAGPLKETHKMLLLK